MKDGDWEIHDMGGSTFPPFLAYKAIDGRLMYQRNFETKELVEEWARIENLTLIELSPSIPGPTYHYRPE